MDEPSSAQPPSKQPQAISTPYFTLVTGIMLIVIVAVAALWYVERRARVADQRTINELQQIIAKNSSSQLGEMLRQGIKVAVPPARPQELSARPATLDGRQVQAQVISADVGRRLGLAPGVVIISDRPATQASEASGPAGD